MIIKIIPSDEKFHLTENIPFNVLNYIHQFDYMENCTDCRHVDIKNKKYVKEDEKCKI